MKKTRELELKIDLAMLEVSNLEVKVSRLDSMIHTLWDNHSRLLKHLGLEDVVMPEEKVIRKITK